MLRRERQERRRQKPESETFKLLIYNILLVVSIVCRCMNVLIYKIKKQAYYRIEMRSIDFI